MELTSKYRLKPSETIVPVYVFKFDANKYRLHKGSLELLTPEKVKDYLSSPRGEILKGIHERYISNRGKFKEIIIDALAAETGLPADDRGRVYRENEFLREEAIYVLRQLDDMLRRSDRLLLEPEEVDLLTFLKEMALKDLRKIGELSISSRLTESFRVMK